MLRDIRVPHEKHPNAARKTPRYRDLASVHKRHVLPSSRRAALAGNPALRSSVTVKSALARSSTWIPFAETISANKAFVAARMLSSSLPEAVVAPRTPLTAIVTILSLDNTKKRRACALRSPSLSGFQCSFTMSPCAAQDPSLWREDNRNKKNKRGHPEEPAWGRTIEHAPTPCTRYYMAFESSSTWTSYTPTWLKVSHLTGKVNSANKAAPPQSPAEAPQPSGISDE